MTSLPETKNLDEMKLYPVETPGGSGWIGIHKETIVWLSLGSLDDTALHRYWRGKITRGKRCPVNRKNLETAVLGKKNLELAPIGTPFQQSVWKILRRIPCSTTTTYGDLAENLGSRKKARAVGSAVGANPIAWLIPCHRVIPSSGGLGSYRWGKPAKEKLLKWESPATTMPEKEILPEDRGKLEAMLLKAQRFEDIARMSGDIAHDLNNLLAPIRMASQMLKRKSKDPALERYVEIIDTSTCRARSVIQEILSFSRETEQSTPELIDVVPHLKELEEMVRETFPKEIELKFNYAKQIPKIEIDHNQLHRAILNILVNAKDAIEGKGCISVKLHQQEMGMTVCVGDRCLSPGKFVCISIRDTGCGIPSDIRESIFDPFFTTKPKDKGTGLGLASVYGIIARAGGFVNLDSEVGKGSTFHILIPQAGPKTN